MLSNPPGKLDDRASRTRLDTELGPRGNELELAFELLLEPLPERFALDMELLAAALLLLLEVWAAAFPAW